MADQLASTRSGQLSSLRGAALYVGALLGPSLLLVPGLAASIAGPASMLAWIGLLVLSGLLAWVFTRLGTRLPAGGVAAYTAAAFGDQASRVVSWCFVAGVVMGAPVVCLIGGHYVADLLDADAVTTGSVGVIAATLLLATIVVLTFGGARTTTTAQLVLVGTLVVLVSLAIVGAAPHARADHWNPFAPHGWWAVGAAAPVLMLSFVGWEAIAPLTGRLPDPVRQLPRIIGTAFVVTTVVYLGLAATTIGVLADSAGAVPLAALLRVAAGPVGSAAATTAAVALTLAAVNAYLAGARALVAELRPHHERANPWWLCTGIVGAGIAVLGSTASGLVDNADLVEVPTTLFLVVYLVCTAAAVRLLSGAVRGGAAVAMVVVAIVVVFAGWTLAVPAVVVAAALAPAGVRRWRNFG